MQDVVENERTGNNLPGALAGVWVKGADTWTVARGEADSATARPMTTDLRFRIASVTKTFTATMILQLADSGALALDDSVSLYVPASQVAFTDSITIRQLLNHTAGIHDSDDEIDSWVRNEPLRVWTPIEVIVSYTDSALADTPGRQYHYSNAGYVLLGMCIEAASGDTVGEFLRKNIAVPLRLDSTFMPVDSDIPGAHAQGYDGGRDVTLMNMSWDWTAGGMISTLDDLRVWAKAYANGTLISPAMRAEQRTLVSVPGSSANSKYGLGINYLYGYYGHSGANTGYQTFMLHHPARDATIVVFFNKLSLEGDDLHATTNAVVGLSEIIVPGGIQADTRLAVSAVVVPQETSAVVSAPVATSESYVQVVLAGGGVVAGAPRAASNSTGAGAGYSCTATLVHPEDTIVIPIWTNQASMKLFLGLRSDTASLARPLLPPGIPATAAGASLFGRTVVFTEFADETNRLIGDTATTSDISDSFAYTLSYHLSAATTALYHDAGFDTRSGSSAFAFYFADTYGGRWNRDTLCAVTVAAGLTGVNPGGITIRVSGITRDLPGGLGGVTVAASRSAAACLLARLDLLPARLQPPLRGFRDLLMKTGPGRLIVSSYYLLSSLV